MTNFEKIKGMTVEEMVYFLKDAQDGDDCCSLCAFDHEEYKLCTSQRVSCIDGYKKWLESEVDDETT